MLQVEPLMWKAAAFSILATVGGVGLPLETRPGMRLPVAAMTRQAQLKAAARCHVKLLAKQLHLALRSKDQNIKLSCVPPFPRPASWVGHLTVRGAPQGHKEPTQVNNNQDKQYNFYYII